MQRVLFIYNRHAGKNKTWASLSDIINAMTEQDCLVTTYPTQYRGDAGEAIVRWSGDFDRVVVAGGDGTLSEAVAGAARLPQPPLLGYIPVGTTNDFAKNLNLPLDSLTDLAVTAVTGVPCTHDMGRCNGQPFLYVAAFGAFTEIAYSTPQKNKNLLGYNAYVLEVVKSLSSIKPYHIKVESEDQTIEGDYLYGMVSNTTSVGRFRNFPPGNPDLSDGLLEVTHPHLPRTGCEGCGGAQPGPADDRPLHPQLHAHHLPRPEGENHRRQRAPLDPGRGGRRRPPGGGDRSRPQRLYHPPREMIPAGNREEVWNFLQIFSRFLDFYLV